MRYFVGIFGDTVYSITVNHYDFDKTDAKDTNCRWSSGRNKPLLRSPKFSHITPILRFLHWLEVNERIEYKLLSLTYKVLTTSQPAYLHNLICSVYMYWLTLWPAPSGVHWTRWPVFCRCWPTSVELFANRTKTIFWQSRTVKRRLKTNLFGLWNYSA